MVFQSYALYPHMTVYENMAFGLKLRGLPRADVDTRVKKAASMLALDGILDRTPRQLSGGQRQRVALGRALVREPAVFLLDEPLSNLDAKLRLQTRTEIARLHRQLGATMIYVTHDQVEAMTLGDRIVVLDKGKVQQIDTPMALYERPANRFVAGFIGSPAMNFIDGAVEGGVFRSDDGAVTVAIDVPAQRITLGIRPEDVEVGRGAITATVELLEPVGNETFVYTRAGSNAIVARTTPRELPAGGENIALDFRRDRLHLFDRETGASVSSRA